jgi:hypothetical protein
MILVTRIFVLSAISMMLLTACGGSVGGPNSAVQPPPPVDTTLDWDDDNWDEKDWT